jgi:hypothetical protein
MTGRDFLTLAMFLASRHDEASWRTSISRGYYAAFHVARDLLEDLGFNVPQADRAHAFLWFRLQNSGVPSVASAGQQLQDLRRRRNDSDYDFSYRVDRAGARSELQTSERIILTLEAAAAEPIRSQLLTGIRAYEVAVGQVTFRP